MHRAVIYVNPVVPTVIGFAQAAGMPGDVRFDFKTQTNLAYPNPQEFNPQMILRPFHSATSYGYDIVIDDVTGASGLATVPGPVMNDRFNVEVYARDAGGTPQRMIAFGRVDLHGYGYQQQGPHAPATYPTGPMGPAGPQGVPGPTGEPGVRGSRWYTGPGAPSLPAAGRVPGDMWLNETNGDVWRWDGVTWARFTGN